MMMTVMLAACIDEAATLDESASALSSHTAPGARAAYGFALSEDGRFVAFYAEAEGAEGAVAQNAYTPYLHDTATQQTLAARALDGSPVESRWLGGLALSSGNSAVGDPAVRARISWAFAATAGDVVSAPWDGVHSDVFSRTVLVR